MKEVSNQTFIFHWPTDFNVFERSTIDGLAGDVAGADVVRDDRKSDGAVK